MHRIGFLLVCVPSLWACQPQSRLQNSKETAIIDQNTMVEIQNDTPLPNDALRPDFAAIGRMAGGCTVFHLGHGIVATAGHCLDTLAPRPLETSCHGLDIVWGVLADGANAGRSRCMKVLDYKYDQQADYALLQVDPVPATAVALQADPHAMKFGAHAMVVGYPKGKALSLSGTCDAIAVDDPNTQIFHHRCDTLPGNSGSPVMDADTSEVIGVHNGDADNSENYGSFLPTADHMLPIVKTMEATEPLPDALQFGPFGDQLKQDLVNFTSRQATAVSFQLNVDVEDGYDKVLVVDGQGRIYEHTGQKSVNYDHLTTPVSVVVLTDYSGASAFVHLDGIRGE